MAADYSQPIEKFKQQKRQAKQRGIPWEMTFDEWYGFWLESGKWHLRGKRKGQFVMARYGDVGAYALGNVFICDASENHRQANFVRWGSAVHGVNVAAPTTACLPRHSQQNFLIGNVEERHAP